MLLAGVVLPATVLVVFRWLPPPLTPYMLGRALLGHAAIGSTWVAYARISPSLLRAVVAAEDTRFVEHHGFDWTEMESAWDENRRGRRLRGASTISMQCARTLFLWPGRSVVRKMLEAYLTVWLEALWPKRRILEVYVNLVEWGDGVYGCEAAARHAFATSCAALDAEQAARLAAILPNPRRWSASRPGAYVRRRTTVILERMPRVAVPHSRRSARYFGRTSSRT
jgi:monofunctional biosynthetic peptidoglycan transglycosylase